MNEREMLRMAAKAIGKNVSWTAHGVSVLHGDEEIPPMPWNPLQDDGDALRLAVKLKLPITFVNRQTTKCTPTNKYGIERWVDCGSYWDSSDSLYYPFSEKYGDDPYAATRSAIVRAAAEIGKAMQ